MVVRRVKDEEILRMLNRYQPITAAKLGEEFEISGQAMAKYLRGLEKRGAALKLRHEKEPLWVGDDEIVRELIRAFPVLIAFYKRRNPLHSEFLQMEWDDLLKRGLAQ